MKNKIFASFASVACLLNSGGVSAHPLFLIQPVENIKVGSTADPNATKHPTLSTKGTAFNDESLFYLPRSVAQINLTFVVYSVDAPPNQPFMEDYQSDSPDKSKSSNNCCCPSDSKKDTGANTGNPTSTNASNDTSPQNPSPDQQVAQWSHGGARGAMPPNQGRGQGNQFTAEQVQSLLLAAQKQKSTPKAKKQATGGGGKSSPGKTTDATANGGQTKPNQSAPPPGTSQTSPPIADGSQVTPTAPTGPATAVPLRNPLTFQEKTPGEDYTKPGCDFIVVVPQNAKIQIRSIPDRNLLFKVVLGNLHGLVTDINKANLSTDTSMTVTGLDTEFHDRTADIIADIGVTAADGAAFAAKFAPLAAGLQKRTPYLKKAAVVKVTKVIDIQAADPKIGTDVPINDVKEAVENCLRRMGYGDGEKSISFPSLRITYDRSIVESGSNDLINPAGYEGLVVRDPEMTKITLEASNNFLAPSCVGIQREMIAQTGNFTAIRIRKRAFNKTGRKLSLSQYGGVTELDATSTSPIKELTGALRQIGDSLNGISVPAKKK